MAELEVRSITVSYGKRSAIRSASLEADSGEIIGFIGADGAGKSSLMHAIAGVQRFEGSVCFADLTFHSPQEAEPLKKDIGLMPQGIGLVLYDTLTVAEHLDFFADIRNMKQDAAFLSYRERLLHMAGLQAFSDRQAGKLSGGMMQKLSLICTLLHRPKLLILDEPTTGVDPLSRLELWEILDEIRQAEGTVVLVSTAYMQEAEKMDRVLLFDEGEIIARGSSAELIDSVRPYTYADLPCPEGSEVENGCFRFNKRTYRLSATDAAKAEPTLEALFFVNALRKKRRLPKVLINPREDSTPIPTVVMQSRGLTKRFGSFIANDHIDMELHSGEIVGLLGANGAGKTTFIKMLLGLYAIDEGELMLLGRQIHSSRDRQSLKERIGYVSQHFALYQDMTVRENLIYFANMHRIPIVKAHERIRRIASELGFADYMDLFPRELPMGINQRFSVAAALLHEPVLLFLDEPTSGVDTIARAQFWEMLHAIKRVWGIAILITTHYMSEAEFCDRVVLLKEGRKIADDTIEKLYALHPNARSFEEIFLSYYRKESE